MSLRSRLGLGSDTVFLVDGSAFVFRAFYAYRNMARSDGFPTNILFIVTRILLKMLREERPIYFSFILDGKGKSHRNAIYDLYKANRSATPEDLIRQIEPLKEIIASLGISCIVSKGCEADDCIASLTHRLEKERPVVIVGADKDLKQCITERVTLWDPASKDEKITTLKSFREETGMEPTSWADYQALIGDSSDNIPGIPKIGPKTAQTLMKDFPTLEELFSRLPAVPPKIRPKLEGQKDNAFLYRELTRLTTNACIDTELEHLKVQPANVEKAVALMEEYELRSLAKEVESMVRAGIWNEKNPTQTSISSEKKNTMQLEETKDLLSSSTKKANDIKEEQRLGLEQGSLFSVVETPVEFASYEGAISKESSAVCIIPASAIEKLLVAVDSSEGLYEKPLESLVEEILQSSAVVVTDDMKELCKKYPALWNIPSERWFDLSIAAYLIEPEDRSYSLSHLAGRYVEQSASTYSYAQHPALFALDLYGYFTRRLSGSALTPVFSKLEVPLVSVLAGMETRGISIDKKAFSSFLEEVKNDLERLTKNIHAMAGGVFNIRSSQQLSDVLFERLGLPKGGKTKGGAMSTSQAALEKLLGKHEIIEAIVEYRKLEKLRSTYLEPLPDSADVNGRIHTTFNQTATATGRLSSSNPNMQNIPIRGDMGGRMRSCFIAEEGKVLVGADYSQIELRVLAHLSQDPHLLEAFHHNEDIHTRTAALIFDVSTDAVTGDLRRKAKTINFGLIYGMGSQKLAQDLGISMKEAKEFMEKYFEKLSVLKTYFESVEVGAKEHGYVATMAGRRRMTPDILSNNNQMRSMAKRQAINTCIQGSAADIIKLAMLAVENDDELKNLGASLLLQIHDELLLEVAPENADAVGERLMYLMSNVAPGGETLSVPLLVEWGKGKSWGEVH